MSRKQIRFCDECTELQMVPREGLYTEGVHDHYCRRTGQWIGFLPHVPEWCPKDQEGQK